MLTIVREDLYFYVCFIMDLTEDFNSHREVTPRKRRKTECACKCVCSCAGGSVKSYCPRKESTPSARCVSCSGVHTV